MNVAVDVTPLRLTRAGTARYLEALLERIPVRRLAFGGAGRAGVLARELWWYPLALSRFDGADVLHCPTYYGPLRPQVPTVVTVHDVAVLRHPEWFPRWTRNYAPRVVPHAIRAAARVIAVSAFTAGEVERLLGVPRDRIRVVPNGVEPVFAPDGPRTEGEYALAVGTLEPRKNLARAALAAKRAGVELRVVGDVGWGGVDTGGATWLGRVDDEELARLYRGARCLVYPSLYEGFGLPVAEALACGTPVVTSRGSAMAELAGGAAVLVDPLDVDDIARGIREAHGPVEFAPPSWDDTARLTLEVYREAAA
ncbi:MAG TPA: glycosyltransferase family 1 protein [Gaiellaceae bacterium]|nr:glycosyltransferase family 1 protein [Gaiellaceae bacterium]